MTNLTDVSSRVIEIKQELAQKCAQDADFREAFLADPKATLIENFNLPQSALDEMTIKPVVEEQGEVVIVVGPDLSEMTLSDDELDMVAGGFGFMFATAIATAATLKATAAVIGGVAAVVSVGAHVNDNNYKNGKAFW